MPAKLRSCPFCGCENIGIVFRQLASESGYQAMCLRCRVGQIDVYFETMAAAAEAWNTRIILLPEDYGIAIPIGEVADDLSDLVPCTGIPKGWALYSEDQDVYLAKVGEHGGAYWTVSFSPSSGLHVEKAAALFLKCVLQNARPILPAGQLPPPAPSSGWKLEN